MRFAIVFLLGFSPVLALAQPALSQDHDLFEQARNALAQVSMPLAAHQQTQSILQQIEAQAAQREAARRAASAAPPASP